MTTKDTALRRDPSGGIALGVTDESTEAVMAVKGDVDSGSHHVGMYVWNTDTLAWERWDGKIDTLVSGDLIVAVDDLEDLVTATNALLTTISSQLSTIASQAQSEQSEYKLDAWLEDGTDIYVGYLKADGAWIIKKFDTLNGTARYVSGASSYSFADPASLSYDDFATEF